MKIENKTALHAHNDIDILDTVLSRFGTSFIVGRLTECYIMQQEKIVFIGTKKKAIKFIEANEGKLLSGL